MTKKRSASSARGRQVAKSERPTPDRQIDFSDIPESTDADLRAARRVGRPKTGSAKQLIAIRLSPQLLVRLRRMASSQGKPYQMLIHELLEKAASRAACSGPGWDDVFEEAQERVRCPEMARGFRAFLMLASGMKGSSAAARMSVGRSIDPRRGPGLTRW